jgi:uncharacterized protein
MMYKEKPYSLLPAILLLLLCGLLSGCLGGGAKNVVRYYLVDPIAGGTPVLNGENQLAIEIIDLHIPQYLERFQIVTRNGDNRMRFSESNQWGEHLRKNLMRTLAINLANRLSTLDIGTPLNRSATLPDYRIHVHVGQFELDSNGKVQLAARWQLTNAEEEELGMHYASLQSDARIEEGDYDQIVADMQELFARFCDQIASSIIALEGSR